MTRRNLLSQRVRSASVLAGLTAAAVGAVALGGWLLALPGLEAWRAQYVSLSAGAALGFLLLGLGIAVAAPSWRRRWLHRSALAPAMATLALGLVGLFEAATGVDLVLQGPLAPWRDLTVGHMPPLTAVALILAAVALASCAVGRGREILYAHLFGLVLLGIAGVGLTGHLYGLDALLAVSPAAAIPRPELVGLLAVGLGLLFARPEVGLMTLVVDPTAGGASVRRLLPVTFLLVVLLGALRVWGEGRGYFPGALGTALFAVSAAFLVGGLIVWNALRLREAELSLVREQEMRLTEIREAEERKDEFLAVLGHELRNPLAALATGLELQRLHHDPERRRAIGDMMGRQVSHLGRLLDDLLDVSRISRGKIELRLQGLYLSRAVERAVEEHRDLLPEGERPRISLTTPPEPVPVVADPTRLHQILDNLLGNAVKYTPGDGRIWVSLDRQGYEAVVRVKDTGIGLDAHEIAAVFEPFRQLGQPGRDGGRRRGGLGLGLTLVRQLTALHGGSVTAESDGPGRGSTFTLRLPVAPEELLAEAGPEAAGEEAAPPPPGTAAPLRVLVVDDQREVADGLVELLGLSGYRAAAAYGGAEALTLAERERPHVVFLDLDLPDLDGRSVARRIRARGAEPTPLLVAVSGFGGERHFERSREAGIDRHLVKPVDFGKVLELLRGVSTTRAAS
ncbi:MAG TPA: hybrid sensor histidine kinase/response regulator [Thermoanaerobaculia bacterium]|nr:hybrid sensor histidine kinase/response regulator [Thermoanaerobaculia bacterium]